MKTSVLEPLFIIAAGLKVCNSIKKRLQHKCFPAKLAKFLRIPYFTEEFQRLLLTFNSCGAKTGATVSNKYQIQLKKVFAAARIQKQPPQLFCKRKPARVSTGVFL